MNTLLFYRWLIVLVPTFSLAAPLSFQAALDQAEHTAPSLIARSARIDAARAASIPAGELPDPKIILGIDNLPVSGEDRWRLSRDFMTMQKIGIMQEVPNSDKRHARIELAQATLDKTEIERRIERVTVRRETALAWIKRFYLERKRSLLDTLDRENQLFSDTVRAQLVVNKNNVADVVLPKQEAAMLTERHDELERDLTQAKASLRRWIGPEGDQPLVGNPPDYVLQDDTLRHNLHLHPELAVLAPMKAMAKAEILDAEAAKKPDWGVELAYQHRGQIFSDMMSVQFRFDLPLFAATRQEPVILAKQQELSRIDAEREAMIREHAEQLEHELAELNRLDRALARQKTTIQPLAQTKIRLQTASYRSNKTDLNSLLTARKELIEAQFKTLELESQRTQLAARLHFSYEEQ